MTLKQRQTRVVRLDPAAATVEEAAAFIIKTLQVFGLADETNPTIEAVMANVPTFPSNATSLSASMMCVDTFNNRVYVLSGKDAPDAGNMLQVIDATDRAAPVVVGQVACTRPDAGYRAGLSNDLNWLFVVNSNAPSGAAPNSIQVFNVSAPTAPTNPSNVALSTFANPAINVTQAVVTGDLLYTDALKTGSETGYLAIYDVSNPLAITQISRTTVIDLPGDVVSVLLCDVVGDFAYLRVFAQAAGTQEMQAWDVSNPAAPVQVGAVGIVPASPQLGRVTQLANNIIYVTGGGVANNAIHPFDFTVPAAPVALATSAVVAGTNNFTMRASGDRVYLCSSNAAPNIFSKTFYVYDAANPAALALLGSVEYANGTFGFGQPQQLHLDV